MTNENKLASMDAVGELPDFGNLLLREGGYPHLSNTQEESQSDAWNDAGTRPDHPCLCETLHDDDIGCDDPVYQYWTGEFFSLARATKKYALETAHIKDVGYQNVQWREVQP